MGSCGRIDAAAIWYGFNSEQSLRLSTLFSRSAHLLPMRLVRKSWTMELLGCVPISRWSHLAVEKIQQELLCNDKQQKCKPVQSVAIQCYYKVAIQCYYKWEHGGGRLHCTEHLNGCFLSSR